MKACITLDAFLHRYRNGYSLRLLKMVKPLESIFFHNFRKRVSAAQVEEFDLAHYTKKSSFLKIIDGRTLHLSHVKKLNDKSEVSYGLKLLAHCVTGPSGKALDLALKSISPKLNLDRSYSQYLRKIHASNIKNASFVLSFCTIERNTESDRGSLAMWRAYGRKQGVAIVIDPNISGLIASDPYAAWIYPVEYVPGGKKREFPKNNWVGLELEAIAEQLDANRAALKQMILEKGHSSIDGHLLQTFRLSVLRTKDNAFEYEREWRAIRTFPWMDSMPAGQPVTQEDTKKRIVKLQLEDHSADERFRLNLSPGKLLKKVIVGPCRSQKRALAEITEALSRNGVENPNQRVSASDIPLRS